MSILRRMRRAIERKTTRWVTVHLRLDKGFLKRLRRAAVKSGQSEISLIGSLLLIGVATIEQDTGLVRLATPGDAARVVKGSVLDKIIAEGGHASKPS